MRVSQSGNDIKHIFFQSLGIRQSSLQFFFLRSGGRFYQTSFLPCITGTTVISCTWFIIPPFFILIIIREHGTQVHPPNNRSLGRNRTIQIFSFPIILVLQFHQWITQIVCLIIIFIFMNIVWTILIISRKIGTSRGCRHQRLIIDVIVPEITFQRNSRP